MKRAIFVLAFSAICLQACTGKYRSGAGPLPADTLRAWDYLRKSRAYQISAPSLSLQLAKEGLIEAGNRSYRLGEARLFGQVAALNSMYYSATEAVNAQRQALLLFRSLKSKNPEAVSALLSLGIYEGRANEKNTALRDISRALSAYAGLKDARGIFLCYTALGHIQESLGNQRLALASLLKAKALGERRPPDSDYFRLLEDLGNVYFKMDSDARALELYQTGIEKSKNSTAHLAHHLVFLRRTGQVHSRLGNDQKALEYHRLALNKSTASGKPEEQARSLIGLAEILKNRNADESLGHLHRALELARKIGNAKLAAEIYRSLSEIYRQQDRFREALLALQAHHDLLDSLLTINQVHETEIARGNYEIESFRLDIQKLELSNERRTIERNAGAAVIALVLLSLIFTVYHFYLTRKLNRSLYISNRIKDKLFSVIGHDLRNPIGGMSTMLGILENRDLEPKILRHISAMKKQSEIALDILSSLLQWGQSQLRGVRVNPTTFPPRDAAARSIALLDAQAGEKRLVINNSIPAELNVSADSDHFDFIVRNLLSNAVKFSYPGGTIELGARIHPETGGILFSFKDSGTGMDREQIKRFNEGSLESSYGTSGEKGTGIGLMLCREYLRANGGILQVDSEVEKGSTFYFTLSDSLSRRGRNPQ